MIHGINLFFLLLLLLLASVIVLLLGEMAVLVEPVIIFAEHVIEALNVYHGFTLGDQLRTLWAITLLVSQHALTEDFLNTSFVLFQNFDQIEEVLRYVQILVNHILDLLLD